MALTPASRERCRYVWCYCSTPTLPCILLYCLFLSWSRATLLSVSCLTEPMCVLLQSANCTTSTSTVKHMGSQLQQTSHGRAMVNLTPFAPAKGSSVLFIPWCISHFMSHGFIHLVVQYCDVNPAETNPSVLNRYPSPQNASPPQSATRDRQISHVTECQATGPQESKG